MTAPPVGRVAIVFTDIASSTELWQRRGAAFHAALARHDAILREALASNQGYEVKSLGDGFMFAFGAAGDAMAFCQRAQAAILAEPWVELGAEAPLRVRVGAHLGSPLCVPNAETGRMDYFGTDVTRAARLAAAGHGGQVLLSEELVAALERRPPLLDLGEVSLKGLVGRHRVWQLGAERFPRLRALGAPASNLLTRADSFVGRVAEVQDLAGRLERGGRLITLIGPGGTGKTRLAEHFAAEALRGLVASAWFVDLSEARTDQDILRATAAALDVPLGVDPVAQLGHALAGRGRALVVFDNLEQVASHAAATLGRWIGRAPEAVFLLTSRVPARLHGEQLVALDPLPEADAALLFRERACRPVDDAESVLQLVKVLDGLPLAIELAAARARSLTPRAILERVARFRLSGGPAGDRPSRHATLRACLDWSWDLLQPREREALARLCVFEGGFSLEAAEALLGPDAIELLSALVDHSLLRAEGERYGMLATVHAYAAEKLGDAEEAEAAHGAFFARAGEAAAVDALALRPGAARALALDLDNLVVAARRALARGDLGVAARAALAAWEVYDLRGPLAEGERLLAEVLELARRMPGAASSPLVPRLLERRADACRRLGHANEAVPALREALDRHREAGDRRAEGLALGRLGRVLRDLGHVGEARQALEQALARHREVGNRRGEGRDLGDLGILASAQHYNQEAQLHLERALALHREAGDRRAESVSLLSLGNVHNREGRKVEAECCYEAALEAGREVGDRRAEGVVLTNLGVLYRERGEQARARACYEEALRVHREVGNRRSEGILLGNLGNLLLDQGEVEAARRCYEDALRIHRETRNRRSEGIDLGNLGRLLLEQGRTHEARDLLERALAIAQEVGDRVAETSWSERLALLEAAGLAERGWDAAGARGVLAG